MIFHDFPCDFPWFSKCDFPWGYMSEKDCCTCCRAIWCLASDCDTGLSSGLFFYHLGYCLPTIYMALWGGEFIMFIIIYKKKKHYKNIIKIPVYIPVFIIGLPHKRNELYIPTTVEIWSKISNIGTHGMAPNGNERTLRGCRSAWQGMFQW